MPIVNLRYTVNAEVVEGLHGGLHSWRRLQAHDPVLAPPKRTLAKPRVQASRLIPLRVPLSRVPAVPSAAEAACYRSFFA
jgi:hypothetical protein